MPKKRKKPRTQVSSQRGGGAGGRTPPSEQLTRLEPRLREWLSADEAMDSTEDAEAVVVLLSGVVELAEQTIEVTDLYAWTPEQVTELLGLLDEVEERETRAAGDDPERAPIPTAVFASALAALLAFIEELGRWRGSVDDYEEVQEILADASGAGDEQVLALQELADAELDPAGVAAHQGAVDAMPLSRSLLGLLSWAQPSTPIEEDALSPQQVSEAAALLGVGAGGDEPAPDHDALVVAEALDALVGAGLVDVRADALAPTPAAQELLDDPGEHRTELEVALTFFLADALSRPHHLDADPDASEADEASEMAVDLLALALLEGQASAEDVDPPDALDRARPLLEELRRYGWLVTGEAVRVMPGLEQTVAEALLMVLEDPDDADDELEGDEPDHSPAPAQE